MPTSRDKYKPHIKKTDSNWWSCVSKESKGYGSCPENAHFNWYLSHTRRIAPVAIKFTQKIEPWSFKTVSVI